MNIIVSGVVALLAPSIFAALSLAIPPKVRSFGYSVAALWILPGLVILPIIGWIADTYGIRTGLLLMVPVFLIGAFIIASGAPLVRKDVQKVWTSAAAQSEVLYARRQGQVKLLLVRGVDVHYDGVQVLVRREPRGRRGRDRCAAGHERRRQVDVAEGDHRARRGQRGCDRLRRTGHDVHAAQRGGRPWRDDGALRRWACSRRSRSRRTSTRGVAASQAITPRTGEATDAGARHLPGPAQPARRTGGNLSGGQQQMLTLGMAFIARPRLLMIDELSLGLAPIVVAQLLEIVRELKASGTTIILVEQSVNVALTVAETAYFMEKGEIRFHGPTAELLERPDVLRSVFLEGRAAPTSERSCRRRDRSA